MPKPIRPASKKPARKKSTGPRRSAATKMARHGIAVVIANPSQAGAVARQVRGVFRAGVRHQLEIAKRRGYVVAVQGPDGELVRAVPHTCAGEFLVTTNGRTASQAGKRSSGHARNR